MYFCLFNDSNTNVCSRDIRWDWDIPIIHKYLQICYNSIIRNRLWHIYNCYLCIYAIESQLLQLAVKFAIFTIFTSSLYILAIEITIFGFYMPSNSFIYCVICNISFYFSFVYFRLLLLFFSTFDKPFIWICYIKLEEGKKTSFAQTKRAGAH